MDLLEVIKLIIGTSNISNVFGIEDNSFLILIMGSFIVGYTCLTFYYKIYYYNDSWKNLDYPEKAIVSLVIGFLSVLASLYIVTFYQYVFFKGISGLEQIFLQLMYIAPFLYFITFSALSSLIFESMHTELDFIKKYVHVSFFFIAILNFILAIAILHSMGNGKGIFFIILLILIILIPIILVSYREKIWKPKAPELKHSNIENQ